MNLIAAGGIICRNPERKEEGCGCRSIRNGEVGGDLEAGKDTESDAKGNEKKVGDEVRWAAPELQETNSRLTGLPIMLHLHGWCVGRFPVQFRLLLHATGLGQFPSLNKTD